MAQVIRVYVLIKIGGSLAGSEVRVRRETRGEGWWGGWCRGRQREAAPRSKECKQTPGAGKTNVSPKESSRKEQGPANNWV